MLDRLASQFLPEMGAWLPLLEVLTTEGSAIRWSGRAHSLSLAGCRAFTADLKRTIYRSGRANHCHRLSPGFTDISVTNSTRQRHFDKEHKAWAWISWHFFFFFLFLISVIRRCCVKFLYGCSPPTNFDEFPTDATHIDSKKKKERKKELLPMFTFKARAHSG